jgi:hypothetical protein
MSSAVTLFRSYLGPSDLLPRNDQKLFCFLNARACKDKVGQPEDSGPSPLPIFFPTFQDHNQTHLTALSHFLDSLQLYSHSQSFWEVTISSLSSLTPFPLFSSGRHPQPPSVVLHLLNPNSGSDILLHSPLTLLTLFLTFQLLSPPISDSFSRPELFSVKIEVPTKQSSPSSFPRP